MNYKLKKNQKVIILVGIFIIICFGFIHSKDIFINNVEYKHVEIPKEFDGYKILQISDLYNRKFGKNQEKLIQKIKEQSPDIIVITGNLFSYSKLNIKPTLELLKECVRVCPVFFVSGEYDIKFDGYDEIKEDLVKMGVKILDNEKFEIVKGNSKLELIGAPNLLDIKKYNKEIQKKEIQKFVLNLRSSQKNFKILLCSRVDIVRFYFADYLDLIISGYGNGDKLSMLFVEGQIEPQESFLLNQLNYNLNKTDFNSKTIFSKGLGNSFTMRKLFYQSEINVITLRR